MALKPQMIIGGLVLAYFMMPKGASAAPPRAPSPRDPDGGGYEGGGGGGGGGGTSRSDAAVKAIQEDLNDFRDWLIEAQEDIIVAEVYDPYRGLDRNNGAAGHCSHPGNLLEDGIDGACTQNAEKVADDILYSAAVPASVADVVAALESHQGLTFDSGSANYEDSRWALVQAVQYLHREGKI